MPFQAKAYLTLTGLVGLGTLVIGANYFHYEQYLTALILLSVASFFAEVYELEVVPKWSLSTAIALTLTAVFVGDIGLGIWVAFLSTLPAEIVLRWEKLKSGWFAFVSRVGFNTGQFVISTAVAALVFDWAGGKPPPYNSLQDYLALTMSFLSFVVVNNSLVATIVSMVSAQKFAYILRFSLKNLHLQFITMGVLSVLMATLYSTSPWHLVLVFVPLALVHYSVRNYLRLRQDSHMAFKDIAGLLAYRDKYTGEHSDEVETLATSLAQMMNLSDEQIETIRSGAAIHDIGKIAIPDSVLNKEGPLDEHEWETMKQHPVIGSEIIKDLEIYREVVPIVRHEHEHWDGSGYPDGLAGDKIPLGARIVAVADVYSALTTERTYRPPQGKPLRYTHEQACEILQDMAGKVLDPQLVDVFVRQVFVHQPAEAEH